MKYLKEIIPYIIIILVVVFIRSFIATPVKVDGSSMVPNLEDKDILILNKLDKNYKRFDIVVVEYNGTKLVKRIVGLPEEHVEYKNNKLYVNGKVIKENFIDKETKDFTINYLGYNKIPKNYYFVIGDNRQNSMDSRMIGFINKEDIVGTTSFRIWPINKIGNINKNA